MKHYGIIVTSLLLTACSNATPKEKTIDLNDRRPCAFEVNTGSGRDTINVRDCNGRRQGKWIRNRYIADKDTIWKYGDTLYFVDGIIQKK